MTDLKPFRTATYWGDWTPSGNAYVVMRSPTVTLDVAIMVEMGQLCGMIARGDVELPYNPEEQ